MSEITQTRARRTGEHASGEGGIERYRHGRVPRAVRERQLIALASELFAERGYAGASMDELAERAGVSKPVIYRLFTSKRELFAACTHELGQDLTDTVAAAVAGVEGPAALLHAGSLAFFAFVRAHAGLWSAAYGSGAALPAEGDRVAGELSEIRSRQNALVESMIVAVGEQAGVELEPGRAGALARALNGMYEGLASWALENPDVPDERLSDWVGEIVMPGLEAMLD